jgi:ATP-dependent Lon protease
MSQANDNTTLTLPVLALRDLVIFPGVTLPIAAGRRRTLRAIEAATASEEKLLFAVLQRENVEQVDSNNLHLIGTIARIDQLQRGLGGMQLVLTGQRRGIALRYVEHEDYLAVNVTPADELLPRDPESAAFVALNKEVRERAIELVQKSGMQREVVEKVVSSVELPGHFADLVAEYLDIRTEERQKLLETLDIEERLRRVLVLLQRQISVLDAQMDIKSQVQEELGDRQRELYLREQLKAIQRELGEGDDGDDLQELRQKIEALDLPAAARKEVDRELNRLSRMGRESMESQVIRNFIETVAELPWSARSEERLDLKDAARILDEDHYGLGDVKDRVLEFLAVRKLQDAHKKSEVRSAAPEEPGHAAEPKAAGDQSEEGTSTPNDARKTTASEKTTTSKGPILLFLGPPGVGKTSVAKSIARAMGREYVRISLGGARDEADIRGHRRTYVASMPGRIIQGMKQAGTKNPVFLLDEVDKLGVSFQGNPAAALLEVLDPAQNDSFTDHYLGIPFDLSEVLFIATANFIQGIPEPLLDRMEVVEFSSYTERDKLAIARQYLVPRQLGDNGLLPSQLSLTDAAITEIISRYTREAGVRQLERELGKVARKVARRIAAEETDQLELGAEQVGEVLGRPRVRPEKAAAADQVGVATGMYYSPVGGDIMFVEVSTMRGKGDLALTGQLGDVMKESARAAWTFARAQADSLRIPAHMFDRDVHVHVPAGSIPKDGPSAGVTMAAALVSALSGRPVRHDLAMTGEITLTGRVLPIGGVKEKVLGAVRSGITTILLPKENEPDLEDLPEDVRAQLKVYAVDELGQLLAIALRNTTYRDGRLLYDEEERDERKAVVAGPH